MQVHLLVRTKDRVFVRPSLGREGLGQLGHNKADCCLRLLQRVLTHSYSFQGHRNLIPTKPFMRYMVPVVLSRLDKVLRVRVCIIEELPTIQKGFSNRAPKKFSHLQKPYRSFTCT